MPLEDEDETPDTPPAPPPKRRVRTLIVVTLVAAAVGAGGWYLGHGGLSSGDKAEAIKPPAYHRLEPAFVVNVTDNGTLRYLQVEVQVMSREPEIFAAIDAQGPAIRDALLTLFAGYPYAQLVTVDGREQLRNDSLVTLRKALADDSRAAAVEAIYFTSFVMQ